MYYSAKEAAAVKHYGQVASGLRGKKEDNREEKNVQQPIPIKAGPAFLFDLDGTLVDSVYQHVLAWREALEADGIELAVWRIHRRMGMSGGLFLNALQRETSLRLTADATARILRVHDEAYKRLASQIRALPGAREL